MCGRDWSSDVCSSDLCYRYKKRSELFIAAEGMYTGQFLYCGRKGEMSAFICLVLIAVHRKCQLTYLSQFRLIKVQK